TNIACASSAGSGRASAGPRSSSNAKRAAFARYKRVYGIDLGMHPKPDRCQCCGEITNKLVLDHCNINGEPREWLCDPCNWMIGASKESADRLRAGARYLEKHHSHKKPVLKVVGS